MDEVVVNVEDSGVVTLVGVAGLCVDDFAVVARDVVDGADVVARVVSFCEVVALVGVTGLCVVDLGLVACVLVVEAEVVARTVDICDVEDFGAEVVAREVDFCDVVVGTTGICVDGFCVVARVVVVGAVVVSRAVDFCEVVVLVVATGFRVDD